MSINITIKTLKIWRPPPPFPKKLLKCGQFCDRFDGVPYKVFQLYTYHLVEVIYNTESRAWEIDIYHQFTQLPNTYRRWDINPVRCGESYCGELDQEKPSISTNIALDLFIKGLPYFEVLTGYCEIVLLHDKVEKCTHTHFHFNDRRAIYNICK